MAQKYINFRENTNNITKTFNNNRMSLYFSHVNFLTETGFLNDLGVTR
jgi:hypothetical protein